MRTESQMSPLGQVLKERVLQTQSRVKADKRKLDSSGEEHSEPILIKGSILTNIKKQRDGDSEAGSSGARSTGKGEQGRGKGREARVDTVEPRDGTPTSVYKI